MLLWHGSRVSNFVGILSQGLRIAPPEAPVSGYLFGKGIYLADMAEKSINYCRSYGQDSALILLIEVIFILFRVQSEIPIFFFRATTTQRKKWRKTKNTQQSAMASRLLLQIHTWSIRMWSFPKVFQSLLTLAHGWVTINTLCTTWVKPEFAMSWGWIWTDADSIDL